MPLYLIGGVPPQPISNVLALPDPVIGDTQSLQVTVDYKESIDGTERTYVRGTGFIFENPDRTSDNILYTYEFNNVGRGKMLEAQDFLRLFAGYPMQVHWLAHPEHNGTNVFLNQEATVFTHDRLSQSSGGPRQESGSFTLAFVRVVSV